ncbi:MotA/TolQ/ExbB proton channel family protein [Roseicitreum antarcticum]|uniref:Outer membrane transport energization protein ExbB n=1 Tax=Roseicitreum antarcticum TaxID=564137 RepID=A0A1H2UAW4_9RHOB|nr:MotA/TolQ/ExbB proton channel family protein [Roseicitreum antarcticum]SDW52594.1 outer membrane transport energization protein ExbB [Roseicitreum antarcticum]
MNGAVDALVFQIGALLALGGPVVAVLVVMSVIALALILVKLWQFQRAGVGRHKVLIAALDMSDRGRVQAARLHAAQSGNHLAPLTVLALSAAASNPDNTDALRARLTGLAEAAISRLQTGFRALDSIAQVAPLLGLFGTVLGMITAFQSLQDAGSSVDPSALAGGIWVALLTTAVGLAVSMPVALILTWFESRVAREGQLAMQIIDVALCSGLGSDCPFTESDITRQARTHPAAAIRAGQAHG